MIWETRTKTIAMLTQCFEKGRVSVWWCVCVGVCGCVCVCVCVCVGAQTECSSGSVHGTYCHHSPCVSAALDTHTQTQSHTHLLSLTHKHTRTDGTHNLQGRQQKTETVQSCNFLNLHTW